MPPPPKAAPRGKRPERKLASASASSKTKARTPSSADAVIELGDGDEADREAIRLSFLIHDVSRMRRAAYDQFMKPLAITRAQWWVLAHLSRHDGMMQTQLADVLEVGKASLGDVVTALESGGWIERRSDSSDRRARRVFLSRSAQSLLKRMTTMENRFNQQILAGLSLRERRALVASLLKIKQSLSVFDQAAPQGD